MKNEFFAAFSALRRKVIGGEDAKSDVLDEELAPLHQSLSQLRNVLGAQDNRGIPPKLRQQFAKAAFEGYAQKYGQIYSAIGENTPAYLNTVALFGPDTVADLIEDGLIAIRVSGKSREDIVGGLRDTAIKEGWIK